MTYIFIGGKVFHDGMPNAPRVAPPFRMYQECIPLDNGGLLISEKAESVWASNSRFYVLYGELDEYREYLSDEIIEHHLDYSEPYEVQA